jgi:hypothetical protein
LNQGSKVNNVLQNVVGYALFTHLFDQFWEVIDLGADALCLSGCFSALGVAILLCVLRIGRLRKRILVCHLSVTEYACFIIYSDSCIFMIACSVLIYS